MPWRVTIDHTTHPHIIDAIIAHAPFESLWALRQTSCAFHARITHMLFHCVEITHPKADTVAIRTGPGAFRVPFRAVRVADLVEEKTFPPTKAVLRAYRELRNLRTLRRFGPALFDSVATYLPQVETLVDYFDLALYRPPTTGNEQIRHPLWEGYASDETSDEWDNDEVLLLRTLRRRGDAITADDASLFPQVDTLVDFIHLARYRQADRYNQYADYEGCEADAAREDFVPGVYPLVCAGPRDYPPSLRRYVLHVHHDKGLWMIPSAFHQVLYNLLTRRSRKRLAPPVRDAVLVLHRSPAHPVAGCRLADALEAAVNVVLERWPAEAAFTLRGPEEADDNVP
ncbi:uncharacterized protein LOC62_04G005260 [Vanrija pseudolonga]|uniref:Uncharacterized protein n=1 Tax=Vanrija pseudolonga TaxID=143232 RepID=A0AAF0YBI1_9TREE|nr:hypothetical protein LOC62_04G005260 [Vanrija pseudolonga]